MARSSSLALIAAVALLASSVTIPHPVAAADEAELRRTVKRLDRQGWIHTRGNTDAHITLAALEMARGKPGAAAGLLLTALRTGPQPVAVRIAAMEALAARGGEPRRRHAAALAVDGARHGTASERLALDEAKARLGLEAFQPPALQSSLPSVRVLALGSADIEHAEAMGRAVSRELGVAVEVGAVRDFQKPQKRRLSGWSFQYEADAINADLARDHRRPGEVVLALTDLDLYAQGLNFVWASGGDGVSIISNVRLKGEDEGLTQARLAKQALTSLLDLLGAPRATHPACVNANALSLVEFDAKSGEVCAETRHLLAEQAFRREAAR